MNPFLKRMIHWGLGVFFISGLILFSIEFWYKDLSNRINNNSIKSSLLLKKANHIKNMEFTLENYRIIEENLNLLKKEKDIILNQNIAHQKELHKLDFCIKFKYRIIWILSVIYIFIYEFIYFSLIKRDEIFE